MAPPGSETQAALWHSSQVAVLKLVLGGNKMPGLLNRRPVLRLHEAPSQPDDPVVEDEIPEIKNNVTLTNGEDANQPQVDGNTLQLNVKLFLREYNREVALEAINYLVARLGR